MTRKVIAALVALIMVFTLMPAGVFADELPIELFEGENVIESAETATYTFIAPDSGFYGFTVPASDEVPASIVISTVNTNYESRIISNGSQKSAFAAVELDANDVCVVTISRPAEGVCTVSRMIDCTDDS